MSDLVKYDEIRREIESSESVADLTEAKARIDAATTYARRMKLIPAIFDGLELKLICERRIGEVLDSAVSRGGERWLDVDDNDNKIPAGITRDQSSSWQRLASVPAADFEAYLKQSRESEIEPTTAGALRLVGRKPREPVEPPEGEYSTVVIDPPWPMQKIEREVRPNQAPPLDYPSLSPDELRGLVLPAAADAHLYLWTTHRFLPLALELADVWGFHYQCVLTWVKNVGMTPFSFMYSTELCLFCRRGSLDLLVKGRRLDFAAKVREHSRKPDEFYALVRDVSPGPRIDMFARESHDGFDTWGNEVERFADAA